MALSLLKKIPARLKLMLDANYKAFYQLGWINGDLELTSNGEAYLLDFLFDKFAKELGVQAKQEIKDLRKKKR